MTRQEKLQKAAYRCGDSDAFISGAYLADDNPTKDVVNLNDIWHDASEEPEGKNWEILLENKSGYYWVTSRGSVSVFYGNWQKFIEDNTLTRWAYVSELLPKGGEEL